MSSDPFRSELDAAHQRIEQLETKHAARVRDLEQENARLRTRLIDVAPSRSKTGRTFGALAMMILGVSLIAGIVFARLVRREAVSAPAPPEHVQFASVDIPPPTIDELPTGGPEDFDRSAAAAALEAVKLAGCIKTGVVASTGHVRLTLAPSGLVMSATVDQGIYRGTATSECIEARFRAARVPAFTRELRL
jgi:hypothetical protein